jgi:uncharacterized protein YjbI with pentapeptide repeats
MQVENKSSIDKQNIVHIEKVDGNVNFHGNVSLATGSMVLSKAERDSLAKCAALKTANIFSDMFNDYLFAEAEFTKKIQLCDIYVETGFISDKGENFDSFNEINESMLCGGVLIEGVAGIGKTTFIKQLAQFYVKGDVFANKNAYFIQGKDIRYSKGNPLDDITKHIGLDDISMLDNAILIIDGYDEIPYVSNDTEANLSYLDRLIIKLENASLIITSRPEFIKNTTLQRLYTKELNADSRFLFLQKYKSLRAKNESIDDDFITTLCLKNEDYEDGISEVLSIPLFLYIIAIKRIDISTIKEKYDLYEMMFDSPEKRGFLSQRGNESKEQSYKIRNEVYYLTLKIAKSMLFSNKHYVSENDILSWVDNFRISQEKKKILKNRFGVELFLKGNQNNLYTFVHTSVYEYFAAKHICKDLMILFTDYLSDNYDIEYFRVKLSEIYPAHKFSEPVFLYVMHTMKCGFFKPLFSVTGEFDCKEKLNIYKIAKMLNALLHCCICDYQYDTTTPFCIKLKNMYLWLYNSFIILFGNYRLFDTDNNQNIYYDINRNALRYILKMKNENDCLFISYLNLRNTYLEYQNFHNVFFEENDFYGATLSDSVFKHSSFIKQKFEHCLLLGTDFSEIDDFEELVFINCDLRFSNFSDSILTNAKFKNCDMRMVSFIGTDLRGTMFENVYIYESDLEDAIYDDNDVKGFIYCDKNEEFIKPILEFSFDDLDLTC